MKKNRQYIIVGLVILFIIFIIAGYLLLKFRNIDNENFKSDEVYMMNIDFEYSNNNLLIHTLIDNKSSKDVKINKYKVILKDENGIILDEVYCYLGDIIKSKKSRNVSTTFETKYMNVKYIDYEF